MWAHKVRLCPCLWFLTRSMSMFCAGGVTSARSTFGFLGRRLWGRGRLLAAPTASVEAHRDSSTRTANIHRHTPAILLTMTVLFKRGLKCCCSNFLLTSFPLPLLLSVCNSTVPCLLYTISHTDSEELHKKTKIHETNNWRQRMAWDV